MFGGFGGGNNVNVRITGDASDLRRETATAQRDVDQFGQKTQRSVSKTASAVKTAMALGAGVAVAKFAKDTVQAASNLQESNNAIQVVFGETADGIAEIGDRSVESFGLSQRAFNEFAVRFSAFAKQIADRSGRDVVDVVDEMTGRVSDFASVHNVSLERAAEVAQSTMAGETEVFRRFGGDVSAAAVETKAFEEGIVESGEALSEQDKILARYMLFMEQTADTAGDFKNTQDDLANSVRTLDGAWEDFQARLGEEAAPVLADTANKGLALLDVLDSDVDLGWTQRLSAGLQLVLGDSTASVQSYIEQKEALNEAAAAADQARPPFSRLGGEMAQIPTVDLSDGMYDVRDAAMAARPEIHTLAGAQARLERETQDAIDAQQEQIDKLRAMSDPFFGAIDAADDLAQAQRDYNKAVEEGDLEAQEDAIRDIAGATITLREKFVELKERGIDPASDAGKTAFREMGLTEEQIDLILGQFQEIEDNAPHVKVTVEVPDIESRTTAGGDLTWKKGQTNVYHEGGIVPGLPGQEQLARVLGGETILPTHPGGSMDNMGNGGGVINITVQGFVGSELQLAQELDRLLTRRNRTSGLDFNR